MKRLLSAIIAVSLILALAACSGNAGGVEPSPGGDLASPTVSDAVSPALPDGAVDTSSDAGNEDSEWADKSLEEILEELMKNTDIPESFNTTVEPDSYGYTLFIDYIEGAEAVSSEPMIAAIAHSMVLLRLPEGADAEATAADIKENADPGKWICAFADRVEVYRSGRIILFLMSTEEIADAVTANWNTMFD